DGLFLLNAALLAGAKIPALAARIGEDTAFGYLLTETLEKLFFRLALSSLNMYHVSTSLMTTVPGFSVPACLPAQPVGPIRPADRRQRSASPARRAAPPSAGPPPAPGRAGPARRQARRLAWHWPAPRAAHHRWRASSSRHTRTGRAAPRRSSPGRRSRSSAPCGSAAAGSSR